MTSVDNMNESVRQILTEIMEEGLAYTATCCSRTYYGKQPPTICGTCKKTVDNVVTVERLDE